MQRTRWLRTVRPGDQTLLLILAITSGLAVLAHWLPEKPDGSFPPNQCLAQTPVQNDFIRCDAPDYDFGRMRSGPTIEARFPVKNICNQAVMVRVLLFSYGRGTVGFYSIEPGETINIPFSLPTDRRSGTFHRRAKLDVVALNPPTPFMQRLWDKAKAVGESLKASLVSTLSA